MSSPIQSSRITKEIMNLDRDPPPGITCYPKDDNITKLEAYIKGPPDTPYENGLFKLDVQMPNHYPFDPPQIRFVTRIYHPNIDDAGRICVDILKKGKDNGWNPAYNLRTTLTSLRQLMAEPNPEDPLDAQIAKEYQIDRPTFDKKALEFTIKFANEEAVMADNQDQDQDQDQEDEVKLEEKVEVKSEYMDIEEEEKKEVAVETKPRLSLSLAKKKSNAGSSQTSTQRSSQSTQSSSASANSLSLKKKQSTQENTASSQVHQSTTSSQVRKSPIATEALDSTAPLTLQYPVTDKIRSLKKFKAENEESNTTQEADVDSENKVDLMDTPKDKVEQQLQTERDSIVEKSEENVIVNKAKAKAKAKTKDTKVESSYFTSGKAKAKTTESVPLSEQKQPIREVQVNVPKQTCPNDTQQQQQQVIKKRNRKDIIVLSDDEDGRSVVHSLRLSKKLKRTPLSLSKRRA